MFPTNTLLFAHYVHVYCLYSLYSKKYPYCLSEQQILKNRNQTREAEAPWPLISAQCLCMLGSAKVLF